MDASTRWLIGIVAGLGVLIVAALAVVWIGEDNRVTFPADTPEGTLQRYLRAAEDDDFRAAYALLSDDLQRPCVADDLERKFPRASRYWEGMRVTMDEVRQLRDGDTQLRVNVTRMGDPYEFDSLFEPGFLASSTGRSAHQWVFEARQRDDGSWELTELAFPYVDMERACDDDNTDPPSPRRTDSS